MNILHLISSGGMYGAEAVILTLSQSLQKAGHSSSIGAFASEQQPNLALQQAASAAGVRMDSIVCGGQIDASVPAKIRALVQTTGADVVHAHGYKADVYGWIALRESGVALVSSCHTWYDNDLFVRLYGALDRRILRRFAGVVAVSDDVRQQLLASGVNPARIRLIRNGVHLQPYAHIQPASHEGALRVGLVGRLAPEKGVDLFLQAAAQVLRVLPETQFVVVGDGPERAGLETMVQDLGLASQVQLAGRSEDMPAFYASLDVLVSASRQEGLPVALLEGMASALPLVASRAGEVPHLVQHESTGLLVPVEDVQALSSAIESMLRHPEQRRRYGLAGRQRIVEEYSADRMSEEYKRLYQQVVASAHGSKGKLL